MVEESVESYTILQCTLVSECLVMYSVGLTLNEKKSIDLRHFPVSDFLENVLRQTNNFKL